MARAADYSNSGSSSGSGGAGIVKNDEDDGDSVEKLRRQYRDFHSAKASELEEQRLHRHYYHLDQLSTKQLQILEDRGQPATIRDKITRKINGIVGLLERMKQDPKAYPRTPKHEPGANIATAVVRYILDINNWSALSAGEARDGAVNGVFGVELDLIKGDQGDPDIGLGEVDNDTFFYDPRSFRYDFSDARYMGVGKWLDIDVAKEMFPGKEAELEALVSKDSGADSFQLQDREFKWIDSNEKRIFVVEHWYIRKGEWHACFYCGDTKLASMKSPFVNEKGKTISRYIMGSVNVDHDGDRYGYIRQLKPLIDELNALVSKRAHLIATRRVIMEEGAVSDVDKLRREAVRADGVIVRNPGKELSFDDARTMADIQSITEAIANVETAIENFGPNVAVLGQALEKSSGRAIALLQQAGVAELGPGIISNKDWKLRVYRACWSNAGKHWTAQRSIRVTDDEGAPKFMGINVMGLGPMGQAQLMSVGPDGQPMAQGGLDSLDVDIILDEGPDTLNVMQDTNETMLAMAQAGVQIPPTMLIRSSNLPSSEKKLMLEEIKAASQPKPFDEAIMQGKAEELALDNDKTKAETEKIRAEIGGAAPGGGGAPAAPGGPTMAPNGEPMMPPVDPIAAAEQDTKAKLADAKVMVDRSTVWKNNADAAKIIMETRKGAAEVKVAEDAALLQAGLVQSVQAMNDAIIRQGENQNRVIEELARVLSAPKRIVTDSAGHPVGVETVQ